MHRLFTPFTTSKLNLHSRLVLPPMATAKASEEGLVTQDILNYYQEKTTGGYISLAIVEHSYVNKQGKASEKQLSIAEDNVIDPLQKLSTLFHQNGVKAAMQINHAGSAGLEGGAGIVGPSAIVNPGKESKPKELSKQQIEQIVLDFRDAAVRTKMAGFDAVEIHSAHGYLLNQFYSPLTNQRNDEYGGSLQNRIRIHLEIIKAIREAVGEEFLILLRLGGCDYKEGGSTIEDCIEASKAFEEAGVNILDLSGGFCRYTHPCSSKPGYFSDMSLPVKQKITIPVILTGGIVSPEQADDLLACGAADLIGVGRAILKDSDWPAKAKNRESAKEENKND